MSDKNRSRHSANRPAPNRPRGLSTSPHGKNALNIARMLFSAYLLLAATGLVHDPVMGVLFTSYAVNATMGMILTGSVITAATLLLIGIAVRPAALYLAVFLICVACILSGGAMTEEVSGALWTSLLLFSGMVLVALDSPAAILPRRMRRSHAVTPRRVIPTSVPQVRVKFRNQPAARRPVSVTAKELEEDNNLFADLWEDIAA